MEKNTSQAFAKNGQSHARQLIAGFVFSMLPLVCVCQDFNTYKQELREQWVDSVRNVLHDSFTQQQITIDGSTMRLHWDIFGDCPDDGRSLYISLHGGGGGPAEMNDSQWKNQWRLYRPTEGVYICPRPPFNTWDLHFRPESDRYYEELIHMMVAFLNVNPDKVYIMGYSAGGDGIWRLAPRLADHWAGASMMAGHPGDVSLLNLRNVPFMVWCGSEDKAYERNKRCIERIAELDSLQKSDPDGYIHEGHIIAGKGHWMDRVDTMAVEWMSRNRRIPYPGKIIWRQEEVTHTHFYYLSCPSDEAVRGKELRIHHKGNEFHIDSCDYSTLRIGLTAEAVDFNKPISVYQNGKRIYHKKVKPSMDAMRHSLYERQDFSYIFLAELEVKIMK